MALKCIYVDSQIFQSISIKLDNIPIFKECLGFLKIHYRRFVKSATTEKLEIRADGGWRISISWDCSLSSSDCSSCSCSCSLAFSCTVKGFSCYFCSTAKDFSSCSLYRLSHSPDLSCCLCSCSCCSQLWVCPCTSPGWECEPSW